MMNQLDHMLMKQYLVINLLNINFSGIDTVVSHLQGITRLVRQSGWSHGRLLAPFAFLIRLRFLNITVCFSNNQFFYSPQKPIGQRAFRVSTSSYV